MGLNQGFAQILAQPLLVALPPGLDAGLQGIEAGWIAQVHLGKGQSLRPTGKHRQRMGRTQQTIGRGPVLHQQGNAAAAVALPKAEGVEMAVAFRLQAKRKTMTPAGSSPADGWSMS